MTPAVLAIVLLSAAIHAAWSFFIKDSRDPLAFNLVQALPICVLFLPVAAGSDLSNLPAGFGWLLAASGLAHAVYLYGLSRAFEVADLTLVYPVARSTPAFVPLAAVPLLGEHVSPWGAAGIATVVAGVWAVGLGRRAPVGGESARSGVRRLMDPGMRWAWLALAAGVGYALTDKAMMTALRARGAGAVVPDAVFAFFAVWIACVVFFVPMALPRIRREVLRETLRRDWRRAFFAATISVAGYGLILEAFARAEASYVVAVRQSSVLFVLVLGVAVLRERPGGLRVAGALATVVGVALIAWGG